MVSFVMENVCNCSVSCLDTLWILVYVCIKSEFGSNFMYKRICCGIDQLGNRIVRRIRFFVLW